MQEENKKVELTEEGLDKEAMLKRLEEIEARIQEIVLEGDKIDIELSKDINNYKLEEHYKELRDEEKALHREAKVLQNALNPKDQSKLSLDNISIWIIVYGVAVFFLCFPVYSVSIWFGIAIDVIDLFSGTFSKLSSDSWAYYPILLSITWILPIGLLFLSWVFKINFCKTKTDKFAFNIVWALQAVLSLAMFIYTIVLICGN